jgi:hypothetical protein
MTKKQQAPESFKPGKPGQVLGSGVMQKKVGSARKMGIDVRYQMKELE